MAAQNNSPLAPAVRGVFPFFLSGWWIQGWVCWGGSFPPGSGAELFTTQTSFGPAQKMMGRDLFGAPSTWEEVCPRAAVQCQEQGMEQGLAGLGSCDPAVIQLPGELPLSWCPAGSERSEQRLCVRRGGMRILPLGTAVTDRLLIGSGTCNGLEREKPLSRSPEEHQPLSAEQELPGRQR